MKTMENKNPRIKPYLIFFLDGLTADELVLYQIYHNMGCVSFFTPFHKHLYKFVFFN